jgi:hypothetical protein
VQAVDVGHTSPHERIDVDFLLIPVSVTTGGDETLYARTQSPKIFQLIALTDQLSLGWRVRQGLIQPFLEQMEFEISEIR